MDDALFWHRLQFAFTVIYHYLFPQLIMGLAPVLVLWKWRALRPGNERYARAVRFLVPHLRPQLRARRRDRHPDGVPVRDELVGVHQVRRWGHRSDARHGRHVRLLSGERVYRGPLLWLLMFAFPFPYIATTAGWMSAELGRQPWLVYGLFRTRHAQVHDCDRTFHDGV